MIEVSLNQFYWIGARVWLPVVVQDLPRYFEQLDFECRGKVEGKVFTKYMEVSALSTLG